LGDFSLESAQMPSTRQRIFAVLLALAIFAAAQEPVKPKLSPRIITATKQVTIFTALENQLLQAVQRKDKAALEAMLAEDCTIEMPDADPLPGDEWLESVMAKDFALKKFVVRQMSVAQAGEDMVVKYDRIQDSTYQGKPDGGEFFVVDLWKKSGDSWKLANRYVSKVSSTPYMPKGPVKPTGKQ
jgi:ketosteroid isomerase-like protein